MAVGLCCDHMVLDMAAWVALVAEVEEMMVVVVGHAEMAKGELVGCFRSWFFSAEDNHLRVTLYVNF